MAIFNRFLPFTPSPSTCEQIDANEICWLIFFPFPFLLLLAFCLVICFIPALRFHMAAYKYFMCFDSTRLDSIWRLSCRHFAIRHISFPLVVAFVCFLAVAELNYLCMSRNFRLTNNNNWSSSSGSSNNNNKYWVGYEKIFAEIQMSLAKLRQLFSFSFPFPHSLSPSLSLQLP